MDIIKYNPELAIKPFGLHNTGVICYFNSMLQSFLSCTSVVEIFRDTKSLQNRNKLCAQVWQLIQTAQTNPADAPGMSSIIWQALIDGMKRSGKSFNNFGKGQEDVSEGLHIFIDALDAPEIEQLFEHRYRHVIICMKCKHKHEIKPDESICVEFSIEECRAADGDLQHMLLKQNPEIDDDYKCQNCNERGSKRKTTRLTMIPEVLVILLKKYDCKWQVVAPPTMTIPSIQGSSFCYKLISLNDHSGTQSGGHYWAQAVRSNGTYIFNDTSFTEVDELQSTPSTYMLWYHAV